MNKYEEILKEFKEWSPEHAKSIIGYRPWGKTSILICLIGNLNYKVKRIAPGKFVMQMVSEEDIKKKYNK